MNKLPTNEQNIQNQAIIYDNGEIELNISVETVNEHTKAIYKEDELLEDATIRKFRIVQKEGKRDVLRYNLIDISSVGILDRLEGV
jgi:hypothetical protein